MNPFRILLLLLSMLAAGSAQCAVQTFTARVIAVLDGDTLLVTRGDKPLRLRMAEIDAPEVAHAGGNSDSQSYGTESQKSLADMVMGKQVQVESRAVDSYGRIVAKVFVDGLDVNAEQVRRGLAWEYTRFHANKTLMSLQREAQQARRGMWAGGDNIEPSQWRKLHPSAFSVVPGAQSAAPARAAETSPVPGCDKMHCSEMSSCADAKRYFTRCGGKLLDGDGDGKPCEKLCAAGGVKPH